MKKVMNRKFEIFCLVVALTCLAICVIRAISTCITGDEAFTYMNYVYDNPFKVFDHVYENIVISFIIDSVINIIKNRCEVLGLDYSKYI